jgi:hypothetical protein
MEGKRVQIDLQGAVRLPEHLLCHKLVLQAPDERSTASVSWKISSALFFISPGYPWREFPCWHFPAAAKGKGRTILKHAWWTQRRVWNTFAAADLSESKSTAAAAENFQTRELLVEFWRFSQVVPENKKLLWGADWEHPHVVRVGFLRDPDSQEVVGAIQTAALARLDGTFRQRRHSWTGQSNKLEAPKQGEWEYPF